MAARLETSLPEIVELGSLTVADLDPLLSEEITAWEQRFAWDFRPSADLLRRFLQIQSLYGYALVSGGRVIGYSYHVCEGRKGLIGDFYIRREYASASHEAMLLGATVQGLMLISGVRRIESQLMQLHMPVAQPLPFARYITRHDRYFMDVNRASIALLQPKAPEVKVTFVPWAERHQEEIAHLVSAAYRGHVDSEINDQYRTIPGARHFLLNIVRYPGCGTFHAPASLVAVDDRTGRVCGVCLASMVSLNSGHITQLCVLPALRQARLGYELLRESLVRLVSAGCTSVSLTVTCSNVDAIRLYESVGFRTLNTFPALVWEGF
jgi:ribosomal protein S18 acetylase RimI-like enzyme